MRTTQLLGLAAAMATTTQASISFPVSRQPFAHGLAKFKRDDNSEPINLEALNNVTGGGYYSEFAVGTPPQNISFLLDTGSSDTWVNSVDADLCKSDSLQSQLGYCLTQFDPDASDTFEEVESQGFDITYLDGRNIKGDYISDTVTIGDIAVENQQLGLALESVRPSGIMGLGFSSNVAAQDEYRTIIDSLVDQGYIQTSAYSLYLNDLSTDAGNILFGGIDTQKFVGDLVTLPLMSDSPEGDSITSFNVQMEGFDVLDPDGNKAIDLEGLNSSAILDSGSTISLLPDTQVQDLWDKFDVQSFSDVVAPFVDCAYAGEKGDGYTFEFRFNGITIQVAMNEMVIDAYSDIQDLIMADPALSRLFSGWDSVCMFGIGSAADFGIQGDQFSLLGATFLRSAYVVYDLENEQLALAQANLNSTESNVVEITPGDLPGATGVEGQSTSAPTASVSTAPSTTATSFGPSTTQGTPDGDNPTPTNSGVSATNTDAGDAAAYMSPSLFAIATIIALLGTVLAV